MSKEVWEKLDCSTNFNVQQFIHCINVAKIQGQPFSDADDLYQLELIQSKFAPNMTYDGPYGRFSSQI